MVQTSFTGTLGFGRQREVKKFDVRFVLVRVHVRHDFEWSRLVAITVLPLFRRN